MRTLPKSFGFSPWAPGLVSGVLCASLLLPPGMVAQEAAARHVVRQSPAATSSPLTQQQRALHAVNRFTFGPRPGEVAEVERLGLNAWFEQQLHPERINDTAFNTMLDQYPAMRLSQAEMVERFPTPAMLRRYANGALVMPGDATERVIWGDASLNYEERKQAKAEKKAAAASDNAANTAKGMQQAVREAQAPDPEPRVPPMDPVRRDAVLNLPPAARMQQLLSFSPEQMLSLQETVKGRGEQRLLAGLSPIQAEEVLAMRAPERVVTTEVLSARLLRDVYSRRQLQAVMSDFWLNHFSVYLRKNQNEPYLLPAFERDAILPNSLGNFEDLLVATARSPAMLVYLDNWESIGPNSIAAQRAQAQQARNPAAKGGKKRPEGINENYARELMELHTLGVQGGYTQQDVIEVAKCFTGWTIDRPGDGGEFLFNPNRHEPGDKTVLGHVIHEGGMNEGLEVLHLLATSPATAHFVSLKLAQRFVSDTPPPALVDRMAATFERTHGDLKAVMLTVFHSPEFWAPKTYQAKVKTPLEFVASALRASDADVSAPEPLVQALNRLGMPLYGMQTPNGYSWLAEDWVSSNALLTRMNFALVLAGNRLEGTRLNWPMLLGSGPDEGQPPSADKEQELETALLGHAASAQTRQAVESAANTPGVQQAAVKDFQAVPVMAEQSALAAGGKLAPRLGKARQSAPMVAGPETPLATTAGLLLGSPEFQHR